MEIDYAKLQNAIAKGGHEALDTCLILDDPTDAPKDRTLAHIIDEMCGHQKRMADALVKIANRKRFWFF